MERNTIIIIALLAVILALLAGIGFMTADIGKQDTVLTFKSNDTVDEGGSIKIMLSDVNGTAIANQTVNVTITDNDNSKSYYSVVTGEKGNGTLKLDKDAGEYDVMIIYGGNDVYNGCNATQKLTIEEEVSQAQTSSTSTSSSNYDPGAFYSPQSERIIYTGEIVDTPGGPHRHLGNNKWEPV